MMCPPGHSRNAAALTRVIGSTLNLLVEFNAAASETFHDLDAGNLTYMFSLAVVRRNFERLHVVLDRMRTAMRHHGHPAVPAP